MVYPLTSVQRCLKKTRVTEILPNCNHWFSQKINITHSIKRFLNFSKIQWLIKILLKSFSRPTDKTMCSMWPLKEKCEVFCLIRLPGCSHYNDNALSVYSFK